MLRSLNLAAGRQEARLAVTGWGWGRQGPGSAFKLLESTSRSCPQPAHSFHPMWPYSSPLPSSNTPDPKMPFPCLLLSS